MKYGRLNILRSVGHIVEERNKRLLEKKLLNSISEFVEYEALILLHRPRHSDNPYLEVTLSMPEMAYEDKLKSLVHANGVVHIHMDDHIKQCLNTSHAIFTQTEALERGLFPIIIHHEVIGVLDFYTLKLSDSNKQMIIGLLHIYRNFIEVLYDNEHDTLTGLLNRKTFDARLNDFFPDAQIEINPNFNKTNDLRHLDKDAGHWVGIIDIDHFKRVNDNFGHIFGDEVLLLFAGIMKKEFRNTDLLFRFGGEEFVVFLLNITEQEAVKKFESFREDLARFIFPQIDKLTASIGMTKINTKFHSTKLLEQADQALYYAKEHGRNQVCNYQDLIEAGKLSSIKIENKIDLFWSLLIDLGSRSGHGNGLVKKL